MEVIQRSYMINSHFNEEKFLKEWSPFSSQQVQCSITFLSILFLSHTDHNRTLYTHIHWSPFNYILWLRRIRSAITTENVSNLLRISSSHYSQLPVIFKHFLWKNDNFWQWKLILLTGNVIVNQIHQLWRTNWSNNSWVDNALCKLSEKYPNEVK